MVEEEVVVERLSGGRFRLLQSPGLVLGVAAEDVFELNDEKRVRVISRGGNVCVQVYGTPDERLELALEERMGPLGGRMDGKSKRQVVYTVPVSVGFEAIEEVLHSVVADFSEVQWFYGNVYDPTDGVTPLNWWK